MRRKANKWLTEQLDKDKTIIAKWGDNMLQPYLESMTKISQLPGFEISGFIWFKQTNKDKNR